MSANKNSEKFVVKHKNKYFKVIAISRTKNCIIISTPEFSTHTTYTKEGNLHFTTESFIGSDFELTDPNGTTKTIAKGGKVRIYIKTVNPPINGINSTISLGVYGNFASPCQNIPKNYQLVDLDKFDCQVPNIQVYLTPPNQIYVNDIPQYHKGETKIVKFDDLWVMFRFIDALQPIIS